MTDTCDLCGRPYTPRGPRALYCGASCKALANHLAATERAAATVTGSLRPSARAELIGRLFVLANTVRWGERPHR